jgi:hypothetical protein
MEVPIEKTKDPTQLQLLMTYAAELELAADGGTPVQRCRSSRLAKGTKEIKGDEEGIGDGQPGAEAYEKLSYRKRKKITAEGSSRCVEQGGIAPSGNLCRCAGMWIGAG